MAEHTAVCDCGMPIVIDSTWVGRYARCPHCEREYVVQSNLSVLPPEEAAAALAAQQGIGPMVAGGPPMGVPVSRATAQPVTRDDTGEDLAITFSGATPLTPQMGPRPEPPQPAGIAGEPIPLEAAAPPAARTQPAPWAPPPPPPPLVVEFAEARWMVWTSLILGLASLPAAFVLWGIGSLIAGATAVVLGGDARRRLPEMGRMCLLGIVSGTAGIVVSAAYWIVQWVLRGA